MIKDSSFFQKTNDPADLVEAPAMGGGLKSGLAGQAYHARDPHVPSKEVMDSLDKPLVGVMITKMKVPASKRSSDS
jgi:hypothetical protein